jgi:hypothetical protein
VGHKIDVSNEMSWGSGKGMRRDRTKGKPLELMIRRCHLLRVPTDSRIEGLGGARRLAGWGDGVRVLGVDSVTDDSSDVVGSVSGERMGKVLVRVLDGSYKRLVIGNSDNTLKDTTERLATGPESGIHLVILIVDTDRVVSTGGSIVGEGGG